MRQLLVFLLLLLCSHVTALQIFVSDPSTIELSLTPRDLEIINEITIPNLEKARGERNINPQIFQIPVGLNPYAYSIRPPLCSMIRLDFIHRANISTYPEATDSVEGLFYGQWDNTYLSITRTGNHVSVETTNALNPETETFLRFIDFSRLVNWSIALETTQLFATVKIADESMTLTSLLSTDVAFGTVINCHVGPRIRDDLLTNIQYYEPQMIYGRRLIHYAGDPTLAVVYSIADVVSGTYTVSFLIRDYLNAGPFPMLWDHSTNQTGTLSAFLFNDNAYWQTCLLDFQCPSALIKGKWFFPQSCALTDMRC